MKLFFYYILVLLPLPLIIWFSKVNRDMFVFMLFFYALLYRPILDALKLLSNKTIKSNMIWKVFIPFWRLKYYRKLYFE